MIIFPKKSITVNELVFSYAGADCQKQTTVRHSHRGCELLYVDSGTCTLLLPGNSALDGHPGSVFLLPAHTLHERHNPVECRTCYAVFETDSSLFDSGPRRIDAGEDSLIRQWFHCLPELNNSYEADQAGALIRTILLRLERIEQQQREEEMLHPGLKRACDYLREQYRREISIGELARHAGVSQSHLNLLFRRKFGVGPQHYLLDLRMKLARRLLLNPYERISDVAEQCGFRDIHYFSRCFKTFHGVPPELYRRSPSRFADAECRSTVVAAALRNPEKTATGERIGLG